MAGTAALSSLAIVFDYALKYSNLKIPFLWLPYLKFDFTGIPIVISALLFGLIPGMFTSAVASAGILARSGDILGSTSKGLAEFSTIIGMLIGLRMFRRFRAVTSISIGLASRVLIMTIVNLAFVYTGLLLIPSSYKQAASTWVLIVGIFNLAEGAISAVGGYVVFEAIKTRAPSLVKRSHEEASQRGVCKKRHAPFSETQYAPRQQSNFSHMLFRAFISNAKPCSPEGINNRAHESSFIRGHSNCGASYLYRSFSLDLTNSTARALFDFKYL